MIELSCFHRLSPLLIGLATRAIHPCLGIFAEHRRLGRAMYVTPLAARYARRTRLPGAFDQTSGQAQLIVWAEGFCVADELVEHLHGTVGLSLMTLSS